MISPNQYGRARRRSRASSVLVVVLVVVLLGLVLYFRAGLSSLALKILAPALAARNELGNSEVVQLRAELASSTLALLDRQELLQENQTLKKLMGRTNAGKQVLAGVLMRPPAVPYDTLLIDAGSAQGIDTGDLVYGGGSAVIGEVSEVQNSTARVTLLSAPGHDYDAQILPKAAPGTALPLPLTGQGGGSLVGQVPAGSNVSVGDPIVVPGVEGAYVGSVSHIDQQSGASFESLYALLPVDLFALQFVEIAVQ